MLLIATVGLVTVKFPTPVGYKIPVAYIKSTETLIVPSTTSVVNGGPSGPGSTYPSVKSTRISPLADVPDALLATSTVRDCN